jgi:hypothetical protein
MILAELVERLGYAGSENYLREDEGDFNQIVDYGHLFRRATKDPCRLKGVYTLKQSETSAIPVVYVCDTTSETQAREVHRLVWNQNTVPFLIVNSPESVRVYPGFCRQRESTPIRAIEAVEQAFAGADIGRIAETLGASAVDAGDVWRAWGRHVRPEYRVDWGLLDNLRKLDTWLQEQGSLRPEVSHALIGKYVYLHYLRDREILSPRKLERWQIPPDVVFGRQATRDGLKAVQERLDAWLNGEVFSIDFSRREAPRDEHIARVAATFRGDEPVGNDQWQLHLDFRTYNFSYIPIEVLSVIYEQFLHAPAKDGRESRGRSLGAYYTPIPVVNLMLSELEEHRPLERGMRVFDPACGSGVFLVQAFRRLIEKEYPPSGERPTPRDLRELLEAHFFGIDTEIDACSVTRLSLILTLLDYVHPPDLEMDGRPGRKPPLPDLRENIRRANFFRDGDWQEIFTNKIADWKADWVVGNPPWKQLKTQKNEKDEPVLAREEDEPVLAWMKAEEKHRPVGNRQMARAFAWRVTEYLSEEGEVALFLPAMTLFEEAAKDFRAKFFHKMAVHTIANFSNLRWVISGGRFTAPAAAFFYRPRPQQQGPREDETIRTYSPLVANQEATGPIPDGERNETWSLVVNTSEVRDVPTERVLDGHSFPWKMASWGSEVDAKLMRHLQRQFRTIGDMEKAAVLMAAEGPQLRHGDLSNVPKGMKAVEELVGKRVVNLAALEGLRDFFAFPPGATDLNAMPLLRVRGGEAGLSVCNSPHVIVSETRNFAVFSDDFIIVPPRQIGIVSPTGDTDLLKALALFLRSDLAFYCEFFLSSGFGIERDRSTLRALRRIPSPLTTMNREGIRAWAALYDVLSEATRQVFRRQGLWEDAALDVELPAGPVVDSRLIEQMNGMVLDAVGLGYPERTLIGDFVHTRFSLNDGKLGRAAVGHPAKGDVQAYANRLQAELDEYIRGEIAGSHIVTVVYDDHSGMVRIGLARDITAQRRVSVMRAEASEAAVLQKCRQSIRQRRSQWVYFDRNLRVYDLHETCIFKPMQRFQWTETQARIDAADIISESVARRGNT